MQKLLHELPKNSDLRDPKMRLANMDSDGRNIIAFCTHQNISILRFQR